MESRVGRKLEELPLKVVSTCAGAGSGSEPAKPPRTPLMGGTVASAVRPVSTATEAGQGTNRKEERKRLSWLKTQKIEVTALERLPS